MYKENDSFETPADNTKIWRYMDFTKFIDIIDRKKMFFPTVATLSKTDPFEGSFPKSYIEYFNTNIDKIFIPETWKIISREKAPKGFSRARKSARQFVAVSCWNMQDEQSAALWKIYCSTFNGIAIESTVGRLKDSLKSEKRDVYIGRVKYIDHHSLPHLNSISGSIFHSPFLYKGKSFEYEKELRALVTLPQFRIIDQFHAKLINYHKGYAATIDPNLLIEKIYLAPILKDSKWQKKIVESVLAKYGLKKKVIISDKKPVF